MAHEVRALKKWIKRRLFALLGKDPDAVVVTFCTGDTELCRRMVDEIRALVPDRRHFVVTPENWPRMRSELRPHRIGLAPVMLARALANGALDSDRSHDRKGVVSTDALRRAAYRLAPRKILAYNSRLERHHLRFDLPSFLFWRGVPLDRIYLRPWWWPWKKRERSVFPAGYRVLQGRACSPERKRVAVLAPYFPYPLAHGGAVRIFYLLREMAREFDVELLAFTDANVGQALPPANTGAAGIEAANVGQALPPANSPAAGIEAANVGQALPPANSAAAGIEAAPLLEFCARVALVEKPRYREPRWSSLLPPEVHEFRSPAMRRALAEERRAFGFTALQVEYTQLAEYGGDVLVEHDVTFDLFHQIRRSQPSLTAWWDWFRWHRFETRAVRRYRRVVVMSKKDAGLLGSAVPCTVLQNGVDLERFRPEPEQPGQRLLFIGSFRHFPNVMAYRFFTERVWPLLQKLLHKLPHKSLPGQFPELTLTVVCGPEHLTYWRAFTDSSEPAPDARIRMLGFVADVRPLYVQANLVIVPTTVSAGTNVKVLEAMAMQRAIVSTLSGCAGLGLLHGHSVWEAETPEDFAAGVATLIADPERRSKMALAAYGDAQRNFDWRSIGDRQRDLLRGLTEPGGLTEPRA
jgi:glycosyltransferase involved in cell wall biosynthesis